METINIEKIMQEIRDDIAEKELTNNLLSFTDIMVDTNDLSVNKFDKMIFDEELYSLNHAWDVQAYRAIVGNGTLKSKVGVFFKKVIRKLTKFYIEPIADDQSAFNALNVKLFNLLECYISENKANSDLIEKLIEEQKLLKEEIALLKQGSRNEEK